MKKAFIAISAFALPALAFAEVTTFNSLLFKFSNMISAVIPFIISLAVLVFIYGIFMYVISGDEDAKASAKDKILYGIVGIFIMISVYGLVKILVATFNLDTTISVQELPKALFRP
jgi:hypothetical protein